MGEKNDNRPRSAAQWYDLGCIYRRNGEFRQAVNAFRAAIDEAETGMMFMEDAASMEELARIKEKAEASIGLLLHITGFVNRDLMNP